MQLTANHRVLKITCPRNAIFMAQQDGSIDLIFDLGSHGFVLDWFLRIGQSLANVLLPQIVNPPQQAASPSHVTPMAQFYQQQQASSQQPTALAPALQPSGSQPSQFAAFQAAATIAPVTPVSSENQPVSLLATTPTLPAPQEPVEQPKPESD